ncbi:MAG: type II toxin-antitoxin system RatA family toxin [Armatimonadota bacterium]
MRECSNQILIRGTADEIIRLAFDLPRWPSFLPHYRWVTVLEREGDRQTVEMACWRTGIPLKWRSHLWVRPEARRMRFRHIGGPARGMDVEWILDDTPEGVRVTIRHDLALEVPVVRTALGRWVVGEVFVAAVAGRTLACLKAAVEAGREAETT